MSKKQRTIMAVENILIYEKYIYRFLKGYNYIGNYYFD